MDDLMLQDGLQELVTESHDRHADAMKRAKAALPALAEIRDERRGQGIDTDEITRFNAGRRRVLTGLGYGAAAGGIGAVVAGLLAEPAHARQPLDVQVLQTASSLERLAADTYRKVLTLPFFAKANPVLVTYARTTLTQHEEHLKAFQKQTTALGGKVRVLPHPGFGQLVAKAMPELKAPVDVLNLTSILEKITTDTYLVNLTMFTDRASKELMASVMGVEAQHLAILRAFVDLIDAGVPQLIKIPLSADVVRLPTTFGRIPFPDALEQPKDNLLAEPQTGAVP